MVVLGAYLSASSGLNRFCWLSDSAVRVTVLFGTSVGSVQASAVTETSSDTLNSSMTSGTTTAPGPLHRDIRALLGAMPQLAGELVGTRSGHTFDPEPAVCRRHDGRADVLAAAAKAHFGSGNGSAVGSDDAALDDGYAGLGFALERAGRAMVSTARRRSTGWEARG